MAEPQKPHTTLAVHRCRFVDYTPSAITALCFPPLPLPSVRAKGKGKQKPGQHDEAPSPAFAPLVVGRANGNIELCEWTGSSRDVQAPQAWVVRKTISGPYGSRVESLALTLRSPQRARPGIPTWSDLRLFSAGGGSDLVEWDIERGCIKRTVPSQGGAIWCLAANPASTMLALGCEDGAVRLLSLRYDELMHARRLDRGKSRILSIAWGPPVPPPRKDSPGEGEDSDDDEEDWTDSWIVTGCSDSSLRKWDVTSGRVLERMGTEKVRGERTLVWAVGVLGDGTIISGDSMGIVKFWDSKTCTQLQSFQGHAADVLCMTISPEGTAVYTSGVDQKVTQFSLVKTTRAAAAANSNPLLSRGAGPATRWVQSSSRRLHSHDVRALAIWPPHTALPAPYAHSTANSSVAPVLVSGGLDMSVVATPAALPTSTLTGRIANPLATSAVATFEDAYHRRLAYASAPANTSAVHLARTARLLMCVREAGVSVWRLAPRSAGEDVDVEERDGGWDRVLDMDLNVQTNLAAGAISDDGRWLAVADRWETKLFRLSEEKNGDLVPRRIREFAAILQAEGAGPGDTGASALLFSPDSSKLVLATASTATIIIVDLGEGTADRPPRVLRRFEQHRAREGFVNNRVIRNKRAQADGDVDMDGDENENDEPVPEGPAASASDSDSDPDSDSLEPSRTIHTTITRLAASPDGQWLASADDRARTHVFHLDGVRHHCALPALRAPVHALAFDRTLLLLALADNALERFDVEARAFPRAPLPVPHRFRALHDPVLGAAFDPGAGVGEGEKARTLPPRTALLWGATWLCRADLADGRGGGYGGFEKRRRRRGGEGEEGGGAQNFKLVTHYRPLLFVDFVAPGELVVVERPLVDVLARLPPAYFKPKYGAT